MKRKVFKALAIGLSVFMLGGCGSAEADTAQSFKANTPANATYSESYTENAYAAEEYYEQDYYENGEAFAGTGYSAAGNMQSEQMQERKLIKTVSLDVETKEYDVFMSNIDGQIAKFGGYVEYMDSYNGSRYTDSSRSRSANMTVRIPQDKLSSFLSEVSGICNVVRRNDSINDVTLTYVDTQSKRDALKIEQERLLDLLTQANSLNEIFTIEERLTTVRYQLESMESQLRSLDNKVTYSSVTIAVSEVKELTPVVVEEKTRWQEIGEGFVESLQDVCEGFLNFITWFLINIPFLILWGVVIIIFVIVVKKIRKKHLKAAVNEVPAENQEKKSE